MDDVRRGSSARCRSSGIPPLAGFWSKDEILLVAYKEGRYVFLVIAILTAALTAFYMARATFLAFFAKPGAALQERARARGSLGHARAAGRARRRSR